MIGPNHTFRLRNAQTNLEVKSLVNTIRLKPYYDPNDRPTNPPDELPDPDAELDLEEIVLPDIQPQNQNANPNPAQPGQSNKKKANQQVPHKQGPQSQQTKAPTEPKSGQRSPQNKSQPRKSGSKHATPNAQADNKSHQKKAPMEPKLDQRNPSKHVNSKQQGCKLAVPNAQANQNKSKKRKHTQSNPQNKKASPQSSDNTPQPHAQTNAPTLSAINKPAAEPNARNQPSEANKTNQAKPQPKDSANKTPTCKDCSYNICQAFSESDIKSILTSKRSNGALYYKVKFHDNSTNWFFPCKIPSHLIREFHSKRTMSGKKRKKPLKQNQHKFFTESQPNVNVASKTENLEQCPTEPELVGIKIINGRSYYLVKTGNNKELQPITMAHNFVNKIVVKILTEIDEALYRVNVQCAENANKPKSKYPNLSTTCKHIHEMELREDGNWYCLLSFRKPELPPEWVILSKAPPGISRKFSDFLSREYDKYVDDHFYD